MRWSTISDRRWVRPSAGKPTAAAAFALTQGGGTGAAIAAEPGAAETPASLPGNAAIDADLAQRMMAALDKYAAARRTEQAGGSQPMPLVQ